MIPQGLFDDENDDAAGQIDIVFVSLDLCFRYATVNGPGLQLMLLGRGLC